MPDRALFLSSRCAPDRRATSERAPFPQAAVRLRRNCSGGTGDPRPDAGEETGSRAGDMHERITVRFAAWATSMAAAVRERPLFPERSAPHRRRDRGRGTGERGEGPGLARGHGRAPEPAPVREAPGAGFCGRSTITEFFSTQPNFFKCLPCAFRLLWIAPGRAMS